jgi:hypothetical protein
VLLTAGLLVVMAAAAAAELSYRPGHYNVDPCAITTDRTCSQDDNGVLRMTVKKGKFAVGRISLTETCDNGVRSFREAFTFKSGTNAKLAGKVRSDGRFRGSYKADAGQVKVKGRVRGKHLNMLATESGTYTAQGEPTFNCAGSIKFSARRS